jgi:hypothetical protein
MSRGQYILIAKGIHTYGTFHAPELSLKLFRYQGVDSEDRGVEGTVVARDEGAVKSILCERGMRLSNVRGADDYH